MTGGRTNKLTEPMRRIEARLGEPLEQYIRRRYHDDGADQATIGAEIGVTESAVSKYMKRLGIEARFPGQRGHAGVAA